MNLPRKKKDQEQLIRDLEVVARRVGLKISYGDMKFGGLKLKSGECEFRGEPWLVLDRKQPFDEKVDLFVGALGRFDLTQLKPDDYSIQINTLLGLVFRGDAPAAEEA